MGRILLVLRLVLADVRRHPAQAMMLVIAMTAATAALGLGGALNGATGTLYRHTRAATAGPDVVVLTPGRDRGSISAVRSLARAPGVAAHSGLHRMVYTKLTARGAASHAVAKSAGTTPGPIDRPLVTAGTWVRPGGVVVERGFATALGVHVGDRVTVAGRTFPVAGIAVTAATSVYPWPAMIGPGGGPGDYGGLVWLSNADIRPLLSGHRPVTTTMYLKLRDPAASERFIDSHSFHGTGHPEHVVDFASWQFIAVQDAVLLRQSQPVLVIGGWLLGFLAIAGVAALAAGRAAKQIRRVGLLKAVGATPGLLAAVLLTEYVALALLADMFGLTIARLAGPGIVNPSASLLAAPTVLTGGTIAVTTAVALALAVLTTLGPTLRAMRTRTVAALADTPRRLPVRARLTRLSALLPTPLLLGLRLVGRRPGRAVLHGCSVMATLIAITALLMFDTQPVNSYGLGMSPSSPLENVQVEQGRHLMLAVTVALVILAAVNTLTITWTTALDARPTMAIARTLGATPGQVTAGLSTAQLLPALPGAVLGIPLGLGLCLVFSTGDVVMAPGRWMAAAALVAVPATAALAAVPARIAARESVARTLSAEAR